MWMGDVELRETGETIHVVGERSTTVAPWPE